MFQGLRTNSLFYVLDKGENPSLQIGQVVSVSNPQTKYPTFNNGFTPQPMETVVDVKVKLNDEEVDFKQMRKNGKTIRIMSKDDIDEILKKNNIVLENNVGYDACYIAHMCLADFYGSSITEEKQMAQFIKDYVDDEDQQDGFIFNRFYADTSFNGIGIPWEDIL